MMKPWYKLITPREDLRDGRPLDASEFAVHLDHVRDGRAPSVYQDPAEFFERTFLTKTLLDLAVQVARRLNGVKVETSAVFNLSTQFGGGKTHALTLLYHLARGGKAAKRWKGVESILQDADVTGVPGAATAVFVGTEFDSLTGRGGGDGTPLRRTPWGEIAFQLGQEDGFRLVEEHEKTLTAPGGDVIERMLPKGKPALILLDELMNYVSRNRKSGLATQLYSFLHNLSEVARSRDNVVLAVSIPASELEMSAEDQSDFERFKKLLDRVGKAMVMSADTETSEIIRRRLFEWGGLANDALETVEEFDAWFKANKQQLPNTFPVENAREALKASFPFHPSVLSVFERKWRALPRFQQTRGVLRLLALWVSKAYSEGYKGGHKDPLISLGTAPLEDALFRAAVFEQLGESRLEGAVTTDIVGKQHAHALRLDAEASNEVKNARLHRKVATSIFFESNGGQQRGSASLPEVRLAVAEPGLDIGNVEQCIEALVERCYYLGAEKNSYRFSFQANLNKLLADRRAAIESKAVEECARAEVQKAFSAGSDVERIFFPQKSSQIPDRPVLTLVVLPPDMAADDAAVRKSMGSMTTEAGQSSRTFKSALIWVVAEAPGTVAEEARKLLAWRDIDKDQDLKLDEAQRRQLGESLKRAERDLREVVWRAYKNLFLLGDDNQLRGIDLGLVHSSAASSLVELILNRLKQEDIVVPSVAPTFLTRYWPPALPEWSTKAVRDAFYASPKFPRLMNADAVKDTISRGLDGGYFAYVGRAADGTYEPFVFKKSLSASEIEIADDVFLIPKDRAESYVASRTGPAAISGVPPTPYAPPSTPPSIVAEGSPAAAPKRSGSGEQPVPAVAGLSWSGEVPAQKWMNFYTKILSRFAIGEALKITVTVDVNPPGGMPASSVDETAVALRELKLDERVKIKRKDEGKL